MTLPQACAAPSTTGSAGTSARGPLAREDGAATRHAPGPQDCIVRVEGLGKVFGRKEERVRSRLKQGAGLAAAAEAEGVVPALLDVDLEVAEGEIYVIMGLSGSGKSTLVRCVNGLVTPTQGRITVAGTSICDASASELRELRQRRMSMVFQSFALLPHLTVVGNVEFGLMLRGDDPAQRRRRVLDVLEKVGLAAWSERRVDELSGGMRQRVGLARALATDPDILIMDEPFSALDPLIRRSLQDELLKLQKDLRKTILFVTHDFDEATRLGSRVMIMKGGRPVQVGTAAELFTEPADDYVRAFTAHADCAALLRAGDVARAIPATADDALAKYASPSATFSWDTPLSDILGRLRLGEAVAIETGVAGEHRLLGAEQVLAYVSRLYAGRAGAGHE